MSRSTDVKTPGYAAIAKKWNLSMTKVIALVNKGAKVEQEHTKSIEKAKQIARDHIAERPDYYTKLDKMEKSPIEMVKENNTSAVRGLGYVTNDPAIDPVTKYLNTNIMSYNDSNGNKFKYIDKSHKRLHAKLGFKEYDPRDIEKASNKDLAEETLNELGSMMQSGMPGTIGLTDPPPRMGKNVSVEEGKKLEKAKKVAKRAAMAGITAANIYTLGDVAGRATEGRGGSPKRDIVAAATALPGAAGWGASGLHYAKKAYDYVKRKKMNEEKNDLKDACWKGYTAKGLKKKGGRMVPNCVPTEQKNVVPAESTARGIYETSLGKKIKYAVKAMSQSNRIAKDMQQDASKDKTYQKRTKGLKLAVKEDWQKVNRQDKTDGLSQKAVNAYRRENPGSKLKTAVTEKNPTGKRAARRKSFCSRMSGMKRRLTSAKTARDPDSNINKALRRWNCHEDTQINEIAKTTLMSFVQKKMMNARRDRGVPGYPEIPSHQYRKDEKAVGVALNKLSGRAKVSATDKDTTPKKKTKRTKQINELKAETLGSYIKKASASRKKSLKGSKPDIKTWSKRQHGINTAIKKLTTEETTMDDNKELINEAIDNILIGNLNEMKENLFTVLQEKANEKLEERKKVIASQYFGQ